MILMKMKYFLIWLVLISSCVCLTGCSSKAENELCSKVDRYVTKLDLNLENDVVLLIASDRYCTPCFESALVELIVAKYPNTYVVLNGSAFPKSTYDLVNNRAGNFNTVLDNQRYGESYFSLSKPVIVFYENSRCTIALSLTNEVIDDLL